MSQAGATRHYPEFTVRPGDDFVEGWRSHIQNTGDPETFDRVSTSKPTQQHEIVLLSEEIRVPTALRAGGGGVPCPFCSPTSPKFHLGRMAYFAEESVVRFVGHRCARTHFGENYAEAEKLYRRQEAARRYIGLWKAVGAERHQALALIDDMMVVADQVEKVRRNFDLKAPKWCRELHRELAQTKGDLQVTQDLGMKDRNGNAVIQKKIIGTAAGLEFLRESFAPLSILRTVKMALEGTAVDLPEWAAVAPEHPATSDILKLGRNVERALEKFPQARAELEDAAKFLSRKNVDLLHRWGSAGSSPFLVFEMKMKGGQLIARTTSYAGQHYANVPVPDEATLIVPPANHPAFGWAKEIVAR